MKRKILFVLKMLGVGSFILAAGCDGPGNRDTQKDAGADTGQDSEQDTHFETDPDSCVPKGTLTPCDSPSPAPTEPAEIRGFIQANAIPLKCMSHQNEMWMFDIFLNEFEGKRIFMMGEAHRSDEIGAASADLFETMVQNHAVDMLVMEIPMDVTDAMNQYIETGGGPLIDYYGFDEWPENRFWKRLCISARKLHLEGTTIPAYGVEVPWSTAWLNKQIEDLADGLGTEASHLVLDTLPEPKELEESGDLDYAERARLYYEHIIASQDTICDELSDIDCLKLKTLALAYPLSALNKWPEFWSSTNAVINQWFESREKLLFDNFQLAQKDGSERIYAHMGAFHTGKEKGTVANMLNSNSSTSRESVYSVVPAFGSNSQVIISGEITDVGPEPANVAAVLEKMEAENYFLATHHPGADCRENPFISTQTSAQAPLDSFYGTAWDAFFWFKTLTPEIEQSRMLNSSQNPILGLIEQQWERMHYLNAASVEFHRGRDHSRAEKASKIIQN